MGSFPWVLSQYNTTLFFQNPLTLFKVLGAMSKTLATIVTQPLIVAKVGLQSRPPPARQGKPFKSFVEVMSYIVEHEGPQALFKGIAPQITKGLLVQGLLMMTKERQVTSHNTKNHISDTSKEWRFSSSSYSHTFDDSDPPNSRKSPTPRQRRLSKSCQSWWNKPLSRHEVLFVFISWFYSWASFSIMHARGFWTSMNKYLCRWFWLYISSAFSWSDQGWSVHPLLSLEYRDCEIQIYDTHTDHYEALLISRT